MEISLPIVFGLAAVFGLVVVVLGLMRAGSWANRRPIGNIQAFGWFVFVVCLVLAISAAFTARRAHAQVANGLQFVPLGYCQLSAATLASATSLSSCAGGIPKGATRIAIAVSTQAVRYRDDGTAPTTTVGMPLSATSVPVVYSGSLLKIQFINQTAGSIVDVLFYR